MNGGPVALMVFTRDLRVADNPALAAAQDGASQVVCAFVHDDTLGSRRPMAQRRIEFLVECLADLRDSLGRLGSRLQERRGDWVEEVLRLVDQTGAERIHLSDDVTPYAQRRFERLELAAGRTAKVCRSPGLAIVPPGLLAPAGGDHYRVFTPFYRRWLAMPRRQVLGRPSSLGSVDLVRSPSARPGGRQPVEVSAPPRTGGERAAASRLGTWVTRGIAGYRDYRDTLAEPVSSRLSADLHFGTLSPLTLETAVAGMPASAPFLRQLCWRDFFLQILAARPGAAWGEDRRPKPRPPHSDAAFEAWRNGSTGVPIVDAALRQLAEEGFLPNRARMIAVSFFTKNLGLDWREGARHFLDHLIDADVALNNLNWQWTAGLGTGTNPHRVLSPTRQARRFDPEGAYVRRYVPELRQLAPGVIHEPWLLGAEGLADIGYPAPIVPTGAPAGARSVDGASRKQTRPDGSRGDEQ